jgi:hypothetical protein
MFSSAGMPALPNLPAKKWISRHPFPNGKYHVQMTIDGHLAYESDIRLGAVLF